MITLARCQSALEHPRVRAFLHCIREGETNQHDDYAYRAINGGGMFDVPPWRHPWHGLPTTQGARAAGAYQHLGTTWAGIAEALGFGDGDESFTPEKQDLGAVYGIIEHGALEPIIDGNLVLACSRLANYWVSLPTLGLLRLQRVFAAYGGEAQTQPAAPIEERGAPINEPGGRTMAPLFLGPLLELIPALINAFGKGDRAKANAASAEYVIKRFTEAVPGAVNTQDAIEKATASPDVLTVARAAVLSDPVVAQLLETGGGGIAGAREFALKQSDGNGPWWRFLANASFWIALVTIPLLYIVVWTVLHDPNAGEQLKTVVVTAIVSGLLGSVSGFFFGSAYTQQRATQRVAP